MRNLFYLLIIILLPTTIYGQYIEGRVLDAATGKPLKNVHIYLDNVEEGTQSYGNGKYYLKFSESIPEGAKIQFSHVGYSTLEIDFSKNNNTYNVSLFSKVNQLNEVEISQNRHLKDYVRFEKMKSMPSRLHAFGSALVDDKIYVAGGNASFQHDGTKETLHRLENSEFSQMSLDQFLKYAYTNYQTNFFKGDLQIYDIKNNTWERQKDLFKKRAHHNVYFYENKLFILGGLNLSINKKKELLDNTIEILNLETGETIVDETNPHQAVNFSSFVIDDNLLVLGGSTKLNKNGTKEYSKKVHLFKLSEGLWYELDSMPTAKETEGIRVQDKIYLIGGFNKKSLTEIERFDVNTNQWEQLGNLFYGMSSPALAAHNNIIYIYNNGKICTFNTVSNELNEYLININVQNSEMHIVDNAIYLIGGLRANYKEIAPASTIYRIAIQDFDTTQIRRSKTLQ